MRWIVSAGADIVVSKAQLEARRIFIAEVTTATVSPWSPLQIPHTPRLSFFHCNSTDGIDGTFITAHVDEVYALCALPPIARGSLVVANTCIWERMAHKRILAQLMSQNRSIRLWFAKQEISIDICGILGNPQHWKILANLIFKPHFQNANYIGIEGMDFSVLLKKLFNQYPQ